MSLTKKALLFTASMFVITGGLHAKSTVIEVRPKHPKVSGFHFEIKASELPGGKIEFRVSIAEAGSQFSSRPDLSLSMVEIKESSKSIKPTQKLAWKRRGKTIEAHFTLPKASVDNPQLCLNFTNHTERIIDGKVRRMPSSDFYVARLKEFVKTGD